MHKKDILKWSKLKLEIDGEIARPNVKKAEVRWCALGHNVGSEIDGRQRRFICKTYFDFKDSQ